MPPKADTAAPSAHTISGKWLIIGVFGLALTAAGGSWWFRYHATHHAAAFWGRWDTWLIRDSWQIQLLALGSAADPPSNASSKNFVHFQGTDYIVDTRQDVSHSPGLVHLRNALLEDLSFNWPAHHVNQKLTPRWALEFTHEKESAQLLFTEDCAIVIKADYQPDGMSVSCQPIADGLRSVFKEWIAGNSDASLQDSSRAAPAR